MTVLGIGLLSACGAGDAPSSPASTPAAPTTATGTATDTATSPATGSGSPVPNTPSTPPATGSTYLPSPEPELTVPARPLGQVERLTGVVGEGVESGCRLLTPDAEGRGTTGRALALLSTDSRLTPGAHVTVEGHRSEDTVTTCQQGVPFTVTRVITVR